MGPLQRLALGTVVLSSLLAEAPVRAESAPFDAGSCSSSADCGCGYVCNFNRCEYRGESAIPTECSSDTACRTGCFGHVCIANRCVIPGTDAGPDTGIDTGPSEPPIDAPRPDVQPPLDVMTPSDVQTERDVPVARDTPEDRQTPPDTAVATPDAPAVVDATPTDTGSGMLVPGGCGCVAARHSSGRAWAVVALFALGLRRRRARATA